MRGESIHRRATRNGQIRELVMANGGGEAPVAPGNAPLGPEPPGQVDADGGMDASRLATLVIMAFVFILLLILAVGVIRRAGEWASSGDRNTGIVAVEESAPAEIDKPGSNVETEYSQKPIVPRNPSRVAVYHDAAEDEADEVGQTAAVPYEPPQLANEKLIYKRRRLEPEKSAVVKYEPAVDYRASVREMEAALETRMGEMQRIAAELRGLGGDERE